MVGFDQVNTVPSQYCSSFSNAQQSREIRRSRRRRSVEETTRRTHAWGVLKHYELEVCVLWHGSRRCWAEWPGELLLSEEGMTMVAADFGGDEEGEHMHNMFPKTKIPFSWTIGAEGSGGWGHR